MKIFKRVHSKSGWSWSFGAARSAVNDRDCKHFSGMKPIAARWNGSKRKVLFSTMSSGIRVYSRVFNGLYNIDWK